MDAAKAFVLDGLSLGPQTVIFLSQHWTGEQQVLNDAINDLLASGAIRFSGMNMSLPENKAK
jgi:hypothetical protein